MWNYNKNTAPDDRTKMPLPSGDQIPQQHQGSMIMVRDAKEIYQNRRQSQNQTFVELADLYNSNNAIIKSTGRSGAILNSIYAMNAFNVNNFRDLQEIMQKKENDFAHQLFTTNLSMENKIQMTANIITTLEVTTFELVRQLVEQINKDGDRLDQVHADVSENHNSLTDHINNSLKTHSDKNYELLDRFQRNTEDSLAQKQASIDEIYNKCGVLEQRIKELIDKVLKSERTTDGLAVQSTDILALDHKIDKLAELNDIKFNTKVNKSKSEFDGEIATYVKRADLLTLNSTFEINKTQTKLGLDRTLNEAKKYTFDLVGDIVKKGENSNLKISKDLQKKIKDQLINSQSEMITFKQSMDNNRDSYDRQIVKIMTEFSKMKMSSYSQFGKPREWNGAFYPSNYI